jgi:2Fe-2S ferredoxin
MGGTNPYIDVLAPEPARQKFTIRFLPMNMVIEVTGLPGSILDIALAHGVEIDHACGGVCACSTCHCIIREGDASLSEMTDAEEDELSFAPGLTPHSRLSCQSVPDGSANLVVEIPNWNRNAVREGH